MARLKFIMSILVLSIALAAVQQVLGVSVEHSLDGHTFHKIGVINLDEDLKVCTMQQSKMLDTDTNMSAGSQPVKFQHNVYVETWQCLITAVPFCRETVYHMSEAHLNATPSLTIS